MKSSDGLPHVVIPCASAAAADEPRLGGDTVDQDIRIVFDISDVILMLHHGDAVGGIFRVVTRIMRHAKEQDADGSICFVFYHPRRRRYVEVDAEFLFVADSLPRDEVRNALDLVGAYFPFNTSKHQGSPVKAGLRLLRKTFKTWWREARREKVPSTRPSHWALRPWAIDNRKTRVALVGMSWVLRAHTPHLQRLKAAGDVEIVLLVHDLIPISSYDVNERSPEFSIWFDEVIAVTTRFIAVSDYTARDVAAAVPRLGGRVEWLRTLPLAHEFDMAEPRLPQGVPQPFVLSVGSFAHPRKNLPQLCEVWGRLYERLGAERLPVLVLAGSHGKKAQFVHHFLATRPHLAGHIRLAERPGDAELAGLYTNCLFTVFPSLFEGWGLPVGESAWCGKLCITSNASSIPEVIGAGADYFDPTSIEDMAEKIARPILDRDYLRRREREIASIPLRRWSDVARDLVVLLKQR